MTELSLPPGLRNGADLPCRAPVVGVEKVGVRGDPPLGGHPFVVGRDDEPALVGPAGFLDGVARSGGIPGPFGALHRGGDLHGFAPCHSVVVGVEREDAAGIGGLARLDVAFVVGTAVPAGQQDDAPGFADEHRRGVAAGVAASSHTTGHFAPRAALVRRTGRTTRSMSPRSAVPSRRASAKASSEPSAARTSRRDAETGVTVVAVLVDDGCGGVLGLAAEGGQEGTGDQQERAHGFGVILCD